MNKTEMRIDAALEFLAILGGLYLTWTGHGLGLALILVAIYSLLRRR